MKKLLTTPIIIMILFVLLGSGVGVASIFVGNSGGGSINLEKGLVGHWDLNGTAEDKTPNSNNGTVTGADSTATDRKGTASKAYSFDGASYIDFGSGTSLDTTTAITVSAWVKPTNTSSGNRMIATHGRLASGVADDTSWHLFQDGTGLYFRISDGVTLSATTTVGTAFTSGQWVHVIFRFDGSAVTKAVGFINGVQTGNTYSGVSTLSTNPWRDTIVVGADGDKLSKFFLGSIDDVRIYNRALSQAEITALYQSYDPGISVSSLQKGLVGHWDLNGTAEDKTPNSNDGTVTGATLTTDRKGQTNKAYSFNGTSDYIRVNSTVVTSPATADWTMSGWVNGTGGPDSNGVAFGWAYSGGTISFITVRRDTTTNKIEVAWRDNASVSLSDLTSSTVVFGDGNWHHIVATRNGNTLTLYVDNVSQGTGDVSGQGATTVDRFSMGRLDRSSTFVYLLASIDDVRVYNRALSATEITALYNSYDPGIVVSSLQKGLIGYWDLNGTAEDKTPNSNDGTVTGATLTTDRKAQSNKAYLFNGSTDYVTVNSTVFGALDAKSVFAWVKPTAFHGGTTRSYVVSTRTGVNGWWLRQEATDYSFTCVDGGVTVSLGTLLQDQWSFIGCTFNGSLIVPYVNGVAVDAGSGYTHSAGNTALYIGSKDGTVEYFTGSIDDVRIYNRALSVAEVLALYNSY